MERGAVIVIENEKLVLIERIRDGRTYYLFPSGGVEAGDTREHDGNTQYYYSAVVTGGRFGAGNGAEMSSSVHSSEGSYRPVRVPLSLLRDYDVRPKALAELIVGHGYPQCDHVLHIND